MKDIDEALNEEEDFINLEEYNNSIEELLKHYPDGVPTRLMANALNLSVKDVEDLYVEIIKKLKR